MVRFRGVGNIQLSPMNTFGLSGLSPRCLSLVPSAYLEAQHSGGLGRVVPKNVWLVSFGKSYDRFMGT